MKKFFCLLFVLVLTGCATPPGQLEDKDLLWSEKIISGDISTAISNIKMGFRHCGRDFGRPEYIQNSDKAYVDIYVASMLGGQSNWIYGKIELDQIGDKVNVRSGVQHRYPKKTRLLWINWAKGNYSCK